MASFIGVILDVSGSMESSIRDVLNNYEEGRPWASSIFQVVDGLIKYDVSSNNFVFVVGVGAQCRTGIIDVLRTLKSFKPANYDTLDSILSKMEKHGCKYVRKWADKDVMARALSYQMANSIDKTLNRYFYARKIKNYLPHSYRVFGNSEGRFGKATVDDIKNMLHNTRQYLVDKPVDESISFEYQNVSQESIFSVHEARELLHGVVEGQDLTNSRSDELLKLIEPFIYGGTPLHKSINEAADLLVKSRLHPEHQKLLFILSDGDPADKRVDIGYAKAQLRDAVKVVGCFISVTSKIEPRRLYSEKQEEWNEGAKFLFDLSSTIPTELVTRAIFIKRGWKIDTTNNLTRLFLHVNHPDNLRDACEMARNVVCCQDALAELLVSVNLDIYINQKNTGVQARKQEGGTCYANASAAVLHLAMHRILGRVPKVPDFEELRDEIIRRFGTEGANTFSVLKQICPKYRLQCRQVDTKGAMEAVAAKRPVIARFRLTDDEWIVFSNFFQQNPNGILKESDLNISRRPPTASTGGHAVVLTSYSSEYLRLMNSWGENWADNGFFRVEKAEVLGLDFIDVFWTLNDLSAEEKDFYRLHGHEVAAKVISKLQAIQVATFTCPMCRQSSLVTEFRGTLSLAICPRCNRRFSSNDGEGNILALNVYLTSLSR